MAQAGIETMARQAGVNLSDARAADTHLVADPSAGRPPHEARARALAPAAQAVMQMAGRAVAARVQQDGSMRARLAPAADPQPGSAPAPSASGSSGATIAASAQDAAADLHGGAGAGLLGGATARPAVPVGAGKGAGDRQDGGNEREPGQGGSSRQGTAGDAAAPRRNGAGGPLNAHEQIAMTVLTRSTAAQDMSIELALRREYDTELAALRLRRDGRKAELRNDQQSAVLRHDQATLRVLRELMQQIDADFNALEAALRQRISDAWVAQAPMSAKAPRPGARTPAEQREVNELLAALRLRRGEARRVLQEHVRTACLRRAPGSLGLLMEWYRNIEDELLELELNPVTYRQREARAQFEQALAQRDHARLLLNENIRAACEADPTAALGLLVELRMAIEERHHGRLSALQH